MIGDSGFGSGRKISLTFAATGGPTMLTVFATAATPTNTSVALRLMGGSPSACRIVVLVLLHPCPAPD